MASRIPVSFLSSEIPAMKSRSASIAQDAERRKDCGKMFWKGGLGNFNRDLIKRYAVLVDHRTYAACETGMFQGGRRKVHGHSHPIHELVVASTEQRLAKDAIGKFVDQTGLFNQPDELSGWQNAQGRSLAGRKG
jgi:hypothetical protein